MGPSRRCDALRTRRLAADVRIPYAERARAAYESGEARLLGCSARARRDDSAAAAERPRIAAGRSKGGSAVARHAGEASGQSRAALPATRGSIRSDSPSRVTDRSERSDRTIWPDGRSTRRLLFRAASEGVGFEGVQNFIREHRQQDFLDNLSRKLLAYSLGRSLLLSDEPTIERMTRQRWRRMAIGFSALVEVIVTSPQFSKQKSSRYLQLHNWHRRGESKCRIERRNRCSYFPPYRSSRRRSHDGAAVA